MLRVTITILDRQKKYFLYFYYKEYTSYLFLRHWLLLSKMKSFVMMDKTKSLRDAAEVR